MSDEKIEVQDPEFEKEFYARAAIAYEAWRKMAPGNPPSFWELTVHEKISWNSVAVAVAEEVLGVGKEATLQSLHYDEGGNFDVSIRHPVVFAMTQGLVQFFDDHKGENYVETTVTSPGRGQFVMTVQRKRGRTPHEFRMALENRGREVLAHLENSSVSDTMKVELALAILKKEI